MKVYLFLAISLLMSGIAYAQKNQFGLSFGTGQAMIVKTPLDGGPTFDLSRGYSIGGIYTRELIEKLRFSSYISYYRNELVISPNSYPGRDQEISHLELVSISGYGNFVATNYFYLNWGVLWDVDLTGDSKLSRQTGPGVSVGISFQKSIKKFCIQVHPYITFHRVIAPWTDELYPERLLDSGIRLNLLLGK